MEKTIVSIEGTSLEGPADHPVAPRQETEHKKPRRRMHRKWPKRTLAGVAVGLALLLVSLLFLRFALIGVGNDRFEPALLTVTVTFAVFAVNFSFLEYQLSPYRALFRGIAWRHVLSAVGVLSLALVPVGAALLGYWPARVSSVVLPIVALSSVVLTIVARSCADPTNRIRFCLSKKRLSQFLTRFAATAHEELEEVAELGLSSLGEEPSHEWDQRIAPRIDFFDPFDSVMALANAALSSGDGQTFDLAADAVLKLLAMVTSEKELLLSDGTKADYKVRSVVLSHAHDRLVQLARMTLEADKTDRFSRSLADILGSYLRVEAAHSRQADEYSRMATSTLAFIAVESLKRGWGTSPLRALMIARECANKGLHNPPSDEPRMFHFDLVRFPRVAQTLADCAMDERNTEFLYRCMEMLGYLGCTAVKTNHHEVGAQCAQSLVYIARKSRFLKLDCFWTRCGMLPWQHARERLWWILSWVPSLQENARKYWLETLSEAYSRVNGKTVEITLTWKDEKAEFLHKQSDSSHKVTYSENGDWVTYDYGDESMLRDLQLY